MRNGQPTCHFTNMHHPHFNRRDRRLSLGARAAIYFDNLHNQVVGNRIAFRFPSAISLALAGFAQLGFSFCLHNRWQGIVRDRLQNWWRFKAFWEKISCQDVLQVMKFGRQCTSEFFAYALSWPALQGMGWTYDFVEATFLEDCWNHSFVL